MSYITKLRKTNSYVSLIEHVKLIQEPFCHYCGKPLDDTNISVDHLTPLCRGGVHTLQNLRVCCKSCNNEKGSMTRGEYLIFLQSSSSKKEINEDDFVLIDDIKVPYLFQKDNVKDEKVKSVIKYYKLFNNFDKPITLKSQNNKMIVDGYSRYIAAKRLEIKKIPVVYDSLDDNVNNDKHYIKNKNEHKLTTYITGIHYNTPVVDECQKEYWWKLTDYLKAEVEDILLAKTKNGTARIKVTKVCQLSQPPVNGKIQIAFKKVEKKSINLNNQVYYDNFLSSLSEQNLQAYRNTLDKYLVYITNQDLPTVTVKSILAHTSNQNEISHIKSLLIYVVKNNLNGALNKMSKQLLVWLI